MTLKMHKSIPDQPSERKSVHLASLTLEVPRESFRVGIKNNIQENQPMFSQDAGIFDTSGAPSIRGRQLSLVKEEAPDTKRSQIIIKA